MAATLTIHDVIAIKWRAPRRLDCGGYVADLIIFTVDDQRHLRPHEVTLFADTEVALVPMRPGTVEHVGD